MDEDHSIAAWLDAPTLLAACAGDAAILVAIVNAMRAHLPRELAALDRSTKGGTETVAEVAHRLQGMLSVVSRTAAVLASALEDAALAGGATEDLTLRLRAVAADILGGIGELSIEQIRALADAPTI